jgi:hypothetical protein
MAATVLRVCNAKDNSSTFCRKKVIRLCRYGGCRNVHLYDVDCATGDIRIFWESWLLAIPSRVLVTSLFDSVVWQYFVFAIHFCVGLSVNIRWQPCGLD